MIPGPVSTPFDKLNTSQAQRTGGMGRSLNLSRVKPRRTVSLSSHPARGTPGSVTRRASRIPPAGVTSFPTCGDRTGRVLALERRARDRVLPGQGVKVHDVNRSEYTIRGSFPSPLVGEGEGGEIHSSLGVHRNRMFVSLNFRESPRFAIHPEILNRDTSFFSLAKSPPSPGSLLPRAASHRLTASCLQGGRHETA